jgi:cytochrome c biogenesis protein CcdA
VDPLSGNEHGCLIAGGNMAWFVLAFALVLTVLWIVGLATGTVAAWFLWITFAIAMALIAVALWEVLQAPRPPRQES